jgi:hypothetical protein
VDTNEAADQLRATLRKLADRKAELSKTLEEIKREEEVVVEQLNALDAIMDRLEPGRLKIRRVTDDELWGIRNRQEAAFAALVTLNRSARVTEIADFLTAQGRNDSYPLVAAALSALRAKGLVEIVERGIWRIPPRFIDDVSGLTWARVTQGMKFVPPRPAQSEDAPGADGNVWRGPEVLR